MSRITARQKRRQLETRGWSDRRILQYMSDWNYRIQPTSNSKGVGRGSREVGAEGKRT